MLIGSFYNSGFYDSFALCWEVRLFAAELIFTALAVSGCGDIQVIGNLHLIFVVVSLHKKGWFEFQVKKMICLDFS